MSDETIESVPEETQITNQMQPHLLQLYEDGNMSKPLVTIDMCGTVTIHQKGKEEKAAEIFWEAVQTHLRMDPILQEVQNTMLLKDKLHDSKKTIGIALDLLKLKLIESKVDLKDLEDVNVAISLTETFPDFKLEAKKQDPA